MAALAELFPDGDYRFHLTLRRGEPRDFFSQHDATGRLLTERSRWLDEAPVRYATLLPEGARLFAEFVELGLEWGVIPDARVWKTKIASDRGVGREEVIQLGTALEPDFLLLRPDEDGGFRLCGGALCFPTGWALEEKLGHPLDFIHSVVPGLNRAIGSPIQHFLEKMKPGIAFHRDNWGIAASDELNLHPVRGIPAPQMPVALDKLWLRVEHQALVALPQSKGIVFGIRIALHRLDDVAHDSVAAPALARSLATMPDALARYKRIDAIRAGLTDLLLEARL